VLDNCDSTTNWVAMPGATIGSAFSLINMALSVSGPATVPLYVDRTGLSTTVGANQYFYVDTRTSLAGMRWGTDKVLGVTVNGVLIDTGRDSQALITGAALAAVIDSTYSLNWKTESGFIHLSALEIIAVAQAVRAHVQSCFDREGELVAQVDAAQNAEELDAIDISFE
jgi:hypothetical protein